MNDKKWELFFDIMEDIVKLTPGKWQDKLAVVTDKAELMGQSVSLEEFTSWFNS